MKSTPVALRLCALVVVCFAAAGVEVTCDPASARPSLADLQAQIDALGGRVAELESQAACAPQVFECEGVCTDTDEDELNCGGCGLACAPAETCVSGVCTELCTDFDGDSYCQEVDDCDDTRPDVHPGLAETCGDALDNDCDQQIDEGCPACDPTSVTSCDQGLTCVPDFSDGALCLEAGTGVQGEECFGALNDCAPGFACIQVDEGVKQCLRWCEVAFAGPCPAGTLCSAISASLTVGGVELGVCF